LGGSNPYSWFQQGLDEATKSKIERLISQRAEAKKEKRYKEADEIRNKLKEMGVLLIGYPRWTILGKKDWS